MNRLALLAVAALGLVAGGCWDTGVGEKVGVIVSLNHEGVFCKTYEGKLIRGGLADGSGAFGLQFEFTIEGRPDLVEKVKDAIDKQYEVRVRYRGELATFCRSESHDTFLTDIEPLRKKP